MKFQISIQYISLIYFQQITILYPIFVLCVYMYY